MLQFMGSQRTGDNLATEQQHLKSGGVQPVMTWRGGMGGEREAQKRVDIYIYIYIHIYKIMIYLHCRIAETSTL